MTQLNMFRCDRCGKKYPLIHDQTPLHITHTDYTTGYMDATPDEYDLCEDCNASFHFLMAYPNYGKRIDALIEEIIGEEEGID
jgi:hypothetical protein